MPHMVIESHPLWGSLEPDPLYRSLPPILFPLIVLSFSLLLASLPSSHFLSMLSHSLSLSISPLPNTWCFHRILLSSLYWLMKGYHPNDNCTNKGSYQFPWATRESSSQWSPSWALVHLTPPLPAVGRGYCAQKKDKVGETEPIHRSRGWS